MPGPGSIAFTGFNADDPDSIAFVALEDLPAGTVIIITDNNWNGTAFATNEGSLTVTLTTALTAGTVVRIEGANATPTISTGTVARSGSLNFAGSGEVVYAYMGTASAPTFLAAIANDPYTAANSLANTGLTEGVHAVNIGGAEDIGAYNGPRTGQSTFAEYRALINNAANWITQDGTNSQAADGTAPDVPFSSTGFVLSNVPSLTINNVSQTEGESGTIIFTFEVTLSAPAPDGGVTFDIATADGTATVADGDYAANSLIGQTIPAGSTGPYQFQVTVNGDAVSEPDENFLVNVTNVTGATVADGQGTGTILTDDLVLPGTLAIADAVVSERDTEAATISFTVTRSGGDDGAVGATWTATLGTADAEDFVPGQVFSGTVAFADGETSKTITLAVAGDPNIEGNETLTVTLTAPTGGASLGDSEALGTIRNDDAEVFFNEFHYDDAGDDAGEAIEIAGLAGTNLSGWSIALYNGNGGVVYGTINLSGVIPNQDDGYGTLSFLAPGLQNGSPDGFALVNPTGIVVQFLSYEGPLTATAGPAIGMTASDVGVSEEGVADGFSLQLTGIGASYGDFTWAAAAANTFGTVNTNQDFLGSTATGLVSVGDSSVVEGNAGTSYLSFIVERAGGLGQTASVDYTINLNGTANSADLAPGAMLSGTITFDPGESEIRVVVPIQGDTSGEPSETLSITLSNPVGNITIADASATGTIANDDPVVATISQIQGASHTSPLVGQPVTTTGIVTAVDGNGYYIQDPNPDSDVNTSEGVFVFTGSAPAGVAVGHLVQVTGTVTEYVAAAGALSVTEVVQSAPPVVLSTGNALPDAILIGTGGRLPPTETFDDDGFSVFDPATDGLDFYESMEGMRVTVHAPVVVADTNSFGETWVVASEGANATGMNSRDGITISAGDMNPERIQLDNDSDLNAGYTPAHTQGDVLGNVTGIMTYSFSSYEVVVTGAVTTTTDVTLPKETTSLEKSADHLTVASYNVENLDPGDPATKFNLLANNIVYSLKAPDIVALQEIQDADGAGNGTNYSGALTAQMLIDAIVAAGGPTYIYVEVAPTSNNSTGGEPNGNIRNGYLYNPDRVDYIEGSARLIEGGFSGTRRPLVADFEFNGHTVQLINVHFTSRIGSDPLMGSDQPPEDAGDSSRTAQAQAVRAYVNEALATNPALKLGVLGDFNGFYWENAVGALEAGGVMTDLHRLNPVEERYTYIFEGNSQAIDHFVVTQNLAGVAQFDAVHVNAEYAASGSGSRGSDHDPIVARFALAVPNAAPVLDLNGAAEGNGSTAAVTEQSGPAVLAPDLTVADADDTNLEGATVSITSGLQTGDLLSVGGVPSGSSGTISWTYDSATGVLTLTGSATLADYQAVLRQVSIETNGDAPGTSRTVTWAVTDGTTSSNAPTTAVTVTGENDPPAVTAGDTTVDGTEDTDLVFSGAKTISVFDADHDNLTVTLSVTNGRLTLSTTDGLTFTTGDGSGDSTMTFSGTTAAINAALSGMVYRGNLNYQGEDTLQVEVSDGTASDSETVTITLADDGIIHGDSGNNVLVGTPQGDLFHVQQGGDDNVSGLGGRDIIYFGAAFTSADVVDGGADYDSLVLQGNYSGGTFLSNVTNVESISLLSGANTAFGDTANNRYDYNLAVTGAQIPPSGVLKVNGSQLLAGEDLTFNGAMVTQGAFLMYGGLGTDTFTGGAQADTFVFIHDGRFAAGDKVNGGGGYDVVYLRGDYSIDFNAAGFENAFTSVESIQLVSATDTTYAGGGDGEFDYNLVWDDDQLPGGATITINGGKLTENESLSFDGSQETNGHFRIFGGAGDDVLRGGSGNDLIYGGLGSDTMTGGAGADTFRYQSAADSTVNGRDGIGDFSADDLIDLQRVDANILVAGDQAFTFIGSSSFTGQAGQLQAVHGGGGIWTISGDVDGNGEADFQFVLTTTGGHVIGADDFLL